MNRADRAPAVVAQVGPIGALADSYLRSHFDVLPLWEGGLAGVEARIAEAAAIVTSVRHGCTAELIGKATRAGAICSWGVGYETLDLRAAAARGIQVSITPDVLNDCVADLAWGLLIATARRMGEAGRYVRDGRWTSIGAFPLATKVSGKRLGVLGLGRIGEAIARRAGGFDMEIGYHSRTRRPEAPYRHFPNLVALAEWSDFLVVACVGGPATRHLVSVEVLNALGPRGIVVNIARGTVIDEEALVSALVNGRVGGAGLDVLEHEPEVPEPLRRLENVVLMPHVGSATVETRQRMEQLVIDNLESFLKTGSVLTPVGSAA